MWFDDARRGLAVSAEDLPDGLLRVWEDMWEHDCLDLDRPRLIAVQRTQGDDKTGLPGNWTCESMAIRRHDGVWQALVSREQSDAWIADAEHGVQNAREGLRRFGGSGDVHWNGILFEAEARLARVRSLGSGWVALASDIAVLLNDAHTAAAP
jgi:hypothetical protein